MGQQSDAMMHPGDVMRQLREMQQQIKALQNDRRLENASIGAGGLRVRGGHIQILDTDGDVQMTLATDGLTLSGLLQVLGDVRVEGGGQFVYRETEGGADVVYVGQLVVEDVDVGPGMLIRDVSTGQLIAAMYAPGNRLYTATNIRRRTDSSLVMETSDAWWRIFDVAGNEVLDVASEGLDRPPIPIAFGTPGVSASSTSSTFETLAEAYHYRTHPDIRVQVVVAITGGATAEVQLWDTFAGTEIDREVVTGSVHVTLQGTLTGFLYEQKFVEVRARISAGAGEVFVRPVGAWTGAV